MSDPADSEFTCDACGETVAEDDDFCASCGLNFQDGLMCTNHRWRPAEGVCLICLQPLCEDCVTKVGKFFFCAQHGEYDIFERFAGVFDSTDTGLAQIAFDALEEGGYHPFLASRSIVPVRRIGRYTPLMTSGSQLVLLPFGEVLKAEELLTTLEIRQ